MLTYVTDRLFPFDDEKERSRRVAIYEAQWAKIEAEFGSFLDERNRQGPRAKAVYCVELNRSFATCREAADFLKTRINNVRAAVRDGSKVSGSYTFRYTEGAELTAVRTGREKSIWCVEQKREYDTLTSAAQQNGIPTSTLHEAIKRCKSVNGLHFEYRDCREQRPGVPFMRFVPRPRPQAQLCFEFARLAA